MEELVNSINYKKRVKKDKNLKIIILSFYDQFVYII